MGISLDSTEKSVNSSQPIDVEAREEGEIVDEFETIISSDEELTMRQRIEELEARNKEIEKLEDISGYFDYDVGYSGERYKTAAVPPNTTHSRKRKRSSFRHPERDKIYTPLIYKPPRKHEYEPSDTFQPSLRTYRKFKKRKTEKTSRSRGAHEKNRSNSRKKPKIEHSSSDDDEVCLLDRNKLRLALRHGPVCVDIDEGFNMITAKEKVIDNNKIEDEVIEIANEKQDASDYSESEIELQELRLIALKSAFLNNVRERKQRKEMEQKKPYSPTDCLQPIAEVHSRTSSPKDSLDTDPCHNMEISPIASPISVSDGCTLNPVDMEIAESSDASSPVFDGQQQRWQPIDRIDDIPLPNRPKYERPEQIYSPRPIRVKMPIASSSSDENEKVEIKSDNDSPDPLDEEVLALRALLLAQKNSPKYSKESVKSEIKPPKLVSDESTTTRQQGEATDPLEAIINIVHGSPTKTAEILKGAVKRFKNKNNNNSSTQNVASEPSLPIAHMPESSTKISTPFANDVDHRIPVVCTNFIPVIGTFPPFNMTAMNSVPPTVPAIKATVKENVFRPSSSRRNTIEIIPIKTLPRPNRKSPLTDITVSDNVATDTSESNKKPKTEIIPINEQSSCLDVQQEVLTKTSVSETNVENNSANERQVTKSPQTNVTNEEKKVASLLEKKEPTVEKPPPSEHKRQRKRSTTLEALQLKTQHLISSGKLISRNKIVATKLLNKAILKNVTPVKRRNVLIRQTGTTASKPTTSQTSRLIRNIDVPTVRPLVISINSKSESESDDYTNEFDDALVPDLVSCSGAIGDSKDMMCDVASPMSLPMESPRDSPLTIATCVKSLDLEVTSSNSNEAALKLNNAKNSEGAVEKKQMPEVKQDGAFQAKLEEFLKNARTKVELSKKVTDAEKGKSTVVNRVTKTTSTPAAVRHLPLSAQNEYRRLVERMKALEKQKLTRNSALVKSKEKTLKVTINNNLTIVPLKTSEPIVNQISTVDARKVLNAKSVDSTPRSLTITRTVQNDLNQSTKESEQINEADSEMVEAENSGPALNNERIVIVRKTEKVKVSTEKVSKEPTSDLKVTDVSTRASIKSLQKMDDNNPATVEITAREPPMPRVLPKSSTDISKPKTVVKKSVPPISSPVKKQISVKKTTSKTPLPKSPTTSDVQPKPAEKQNPSSGFDIKTVKECEEKFQEISINLLESTSKTLQFALDAQKETREKLLLQQELDELRKRAGELECKIKAKDTNVSNMITKISSSRASITVLKEQTTYLDKFSADLCKRLGDERNNSLYVEQKQKFIKMSRDLLMEIKKLKSLQNQGSIKADTQLLDTSVDRKVAVDEAIQVNLLLDSAHATENSAASRGLNDSITAVSSKTNANDDSVMVSDGIIPNCDPNSSSNLLESINTTKEMSFKLADTIQDTDKDLSKDDDRVNVQNDSVDNSKENTSTENSCVKEESLAEERSAITEIADVSSNDKVLYNRTCAVSESENRKKRTTILPRSNDYESPLQFSNSDNGSLDPNGILCPYQLMGQCDDKECKYNHLET